jgi:hypothetical protein
VVFNLDEIIPHNQLLPTDSENCRKVPCDKRATRLCCADGYHSLSPSRGYTLREMFDQTWPTLIPNLAETVMKTYPGSATPEDTINLAGEGGFFEPRSDILTPLMTTHRLGDIPDTPAGRSTPSLGQRHSTFWSMLRSAECCTPSARRFGPGAWSLMAYTPTTTGGSRRTRR